MISFLTSCSKSKKIDELQCQSINMEPQIISDGYKKLPEFVIVANAVLIIIIIIIVCPSKFNVDCLF